MAQAFDTVSDLPESDILLPLPQIIRSQNPTHSSSNAMEVDSSTDPGMPSLAVYLAACVRYTTSAAPLRLAVKEKLSDAEELMSVLEILNTWIEEWAGKEQIPDSKSKRPEDVKADTPSLENVSISCLRMQNVCTQNSRFLSRSLRSSRQSWIRLSSHS